MAAAVKVPDSLLSDRYWRGTLFLFSNHPKLRQYLTTEYFDLKKETIQGPRLKRISASWSTSERFMLKVALHLYSSRNKVDFSEMDQLDSINTELVLKAMRYRYG